MSDARQQYEIVIVLADRTHGWKSGESERGRERIKSETGRNNRIAVTLTPLSACPPYSIVSTPSGLQP
jgi:hypothetical protein